MAKYESYNTATKITEAFLIGCFGFIIFTFLIGAVYAFFIMLLWNALVPDIFHLGTITFWQAWGLLFLSNMLIKSVTYNGKT